MDHPASDHGHGAPKLVERVQRGGQQIPVEDGEIGQPSGSQHPALPLGEGEPGAAQGECAERLKAGEPL